MTAGPAHGSSAITLASLVSRERNILFITAHGEDADEDVLWDVHEMVHGPRPEIHVRADSSGLIGLHYLGHLAENTEPLGLALLLSQGLALCL